MKKLITLSLAFTLLLSCSSERNDSENSIPSEGNNPSEGSNPSEAEVSSVRINSLGFLPSQQKEATIASETERFSLKRADNNETVFQKKAAGPFTQKDTGEKLWIANFSEFTTDGEYYIEIDDGLRSVNFPIGSNIYNEPFAVAMNGFYLLRCGAPVHAEHNGDIFEHPGCHHEDGYGDYIGHADTQFDGTGGWHDAGDYGKYTVNAGITMGVLLSTWDYFRPGNEAGSLPDFLQELKWEMGWMLKMPYPDGSGRVSHKLTRTNFSGFIMPQEDQAKRYFTEWSSAATASFAATAAKASRIFANYDKEYADKCLTAARLSYNFLKENPKEKPFEQGVFETGGYQTGDKDDRLWAAAELWETTGETVYLKDFEKMASEIDYNSDENWDWGNVANLALFTYALSERSGRDPQALQSIRENIIKTSDIITQKSESDQYRRPLDRYYWGCNGTVVRQTLNLYVANKLQPDSKYTNTALNAIGHLFGRNYFSRSYVTGVGHNPPMSPHDRRSGADNIEAPWPGYLVGGGHTATDWVDEEEDYARNEIAINWQAPLVFALAWMMN